MLNRFRVRLACADALPQLALLGLISGLLAGAVIVLFRLGIEYWQASFLPAANTENYEGLSASMRFLLPSAGGLAIGILFQYAQKQGAGSIQVGIVHVMERLAYHQGHLPLRNFILQFVGASISLVSGHSVGREGPGVHLGAASGSFVGQWLKLPNNSTQTLLACGAAASIAASFNTPIAAVIFTMEVIMMEYTLAAFTPIILAAVSATALSRFVFGAEPAFSVPPLQLASLLELPYLLVMGLFIGGLAAAFIFSLTWLTKVSKNIIIWQRLSLAGILTGLCALWVPEIMGVGYDTVTQSMLGQIGISLLVLIVIFKILATTIGLGLGLPGGLIGPTLLIGAAAGALWGHFAEMIFPGQVASPGFYAMLGMGAMMGATLQAPLAALLAMLELTTNTHIILPGMLVVVIAGLTSSYIFRCDSVFTLLLKARNLDIRNDPVTQSLRRTGVLSLLNTAFAQSSRYLSPSSAAALLSHQPQWIIISDETATENAAKTSQPYSSGILLRATDLSLYLQSLDKNETDDVDLLNIPAQRQQWVVINPQATLQQALDAMNEDNVNAVCVQSHQRTATKQILGIINRQMLEAYYKK
jgi:chloride channel protein, CIC family